MLIPSTHPWLDITRSIHSAMATWPDNPGVEISGSQCMHEGDVCNVSKLAAGTHTGTHVDGLRHFIQNGQGIDGMPVDQLIGPACVVTVESEAQIELKDFDQACIRKGGRILFRTRNSIDRLHESAEFCETFVHLSEEVALWLAQMEVACVGVDYLSVGGFEGNVVEVHHALLGNGIYAIEGLVLSDVDDGWHNLVCLPIKLKDGDAGLARAILQKIDVEE